MNTPDDFNATGAIQSMPGGLQYIDLAPGTGAGAVAGQTVTVHYTGWLTNGTKFDSSRDRGQPFPVQPLGGGRVIKGWDQGLVGMKVGGRRKLIIPPELGYGAQGSPPVIPANATLVFVVEVLAIQ
jgi:FKBP-type peptidyl-prolyl cis-trans isomerase